MTLRQQVKQVLEQTDIAQESLIVGVSGGPDSLALLHILAALRVELGLTLVVGHIDHQLRGDTSRADAEFVSQTCQQWNIPCHIEHIDVARIAKEHSYTIEEAARRVRYSVLNKLAKQHQARWVAVAHNANDQAETVLMNLIRGTGLAGLTGMDTTSNLSYVHMLPTNKEPSLARILRPLLDIPRTDIEAYCGLHQLTPRIDETNTDLRYTRNKLRHQIIPLLKEINPSVQDAILRMADNLRAENDLLGSLANKASLDVVEADNSFWLSYERDTFVQLHPSIQRRLLMRTSSFAEMSPPSAAQVEQARRVALTGHTGDKSQLGSCWLHVVYQSLIISPTNRVARPPWPWVHNSMKVTEQTQYALDNAWEISVTPYRGQLNDASWEQLLADRWTAVINAAPPYELRPRQPGDKFYPQGAGGAQSIKKFMNQAKIPADWRDELPLLVKDGEIAWVCGFRVDQRFIATEDNKDNLWLVRLQG